MTEDEADELALSYGVGIFFNSEGSVTERFRKAVDGYQREKWRMTSQGRESRLHPVRIDLRGIPE